MKQRHALYAVAGPDPEREGFRKVIGVTTDEEEAESLLASGVMTLAAEFAKKLRAGGTVSIIVRRGNSGDPRTYGYGSFAMDNPNADESRWRSRNWDFGVFATHIEEGEDDDA